jgi:2-polyprenyl-3-methyl-5-hydroxy-6-metoxy-1,4-benzoquinol methylase
VSGQEKEAVERCPICGDYRARHVLTGVDRLHDFPGSFDIVACASCKLWRQSPLLSPEQASGFYPQTYKPHLNLRPVTPVSIEKTSHRLRRRYMQWLENDRPSLYSMSPGQAVKTTASALFARTNRFLFNPHSFFGNGKKLLDIGCGDGHFAGEMSELGWRPYGVELSKEAAVRAGERGLTVVQGSFPETQAELEEHGPFDLISMRHVIEHLADPGATVRAARDLLKPGGWLAIWTPIRTGLVATRYKDCWHNLDLPRHQVLFDRRMLRAMLRQAGFEVRFMACHSSARSLLRSRACRNGTQEEGANNGVTPFAHLAAQVGVKLLDLVGWGDAGLALAFRPGPGKDANNHRPGVGAGR